MGAHIDVGRMIRNRLMNTERRGAFLCLWERTITETESDADGLLAKLADGRLHSVLLGHGSVQDIGSLGTFGTLMVMASS